MDRMMQDMNKRIDAGEFDPMGILGDQLATDYHKPDQCEIPSHDPYTPPSDEISSREP